MKAILASSGIAHAAMGDKTRLLEGAIEALQLTLNNLNCKASMSYLYRKLTIGFIVFATLTISACNSEKASTVTNNTVKQHLEPLTTSEQTSNLKSNVEAPALPSENIERILIGGSLQAISFSQVGKTLIGGAIQGVPLNISSIVSTLGGTGFIGTQNITGAIAKFDHPQGITKVGDNLYVADHRNHTIRKIVIDTGEVTIFAGSGSDTSVDGTGPSASFQYPRGITSDGKNLYVTCRSNVRKIVIATRVVSTMPIWVANAPVDVHGELKLLSDPHGITISGRSLYIADAGDSRIRRIQIETGEMSTVAGTGMHGHHDAVGLDAKFMNPEGIVSDGYNIYVADTFNNRIRKIDLSTGIVSTLAGSGIAGVQDGIGTGASFNEPTDITYHSGNLYITSKGYIRKIVINTGVVTTLSGSGGSSITTDGTNLYVVDYFKGSVSLIAIADGKAATLASSESIDTIGSQGTVATAPSFHAPRGITSDGNNLYVTDAFNNKIRKIVINTGAVTTLSGSGENGSGDGSANSASFNFPNGITTDGTNLYVADTNNSAIRLISFANGKVTTLAGKHTPSLQNKQPDMQLVSFNEPRGTSTDGKNLYIADTRNNIIRKIELATGLESILAGSGYVGSYDAIGSAATFNHPASITNDSNSLYIADTENHKIRKVDIATGVVTTIAGSGKLGSEDGTGNAASFNSPDGITTDNTNLYIADSGNNTVRKIEISSGKVSTMAGSGAIGFLDATGTDAVFNRPTGVTTDGSNLYVTDTNNNKIRKIVISTGVVTTLAGSGVKGSTDGSTSLGAAASFNQSFGITTDGSNLYVSDTINHTIRQIVIATGATSTLAGNGNIGSTNGEGSNATFSGPFGITTDGRYLYVADTVNNKIRKIEISSRTVTTLAGSRVSGARDATGTSASFNQPVGITNDKDNLYIADTYNHKIRKINLATAKVSTLAGSGGKGLIDGTGKAAKFNYPFGITTDGENLYVADTHNHAIRRIEIKTGSVTTLAGSTTPGLLDGTGQATSFNYPNSVTTDGINLYVADTSNHAIRKIVITTGEVTTLAGSGTLGSLDAQGRAAQFNFPRGITTDGASCYIADTENHKIRKIK